MKKYYLNLDEETNELKLKDQCTLSEEKTGLLETMFLNGELVKETTFTEIRNKILSTIN